MRNLKIGIWIKYFNIHYKILMITELYIICKDYHNSVQKIYLNENFTVI